MKPTKLYTTINEFKMYLESTKEVMHPKVANLMEDCYDTILEFNDQFRDLRGRELKYTIMDGEFYLRFLKKFPTKDPNEGLEDLKEFVTDTIIEHRGIPVNIYFNNYTPETAKITIEPEDLSKYNIRLEPAGYNPEKNPYKTKNQHLLDLPKQRVTNIDELVKERGYTEDEIKSLSNLYIYDYHFNSLNGIGRFTNLKDLTVVETSLTSLEGIEQCTSLIRLQCFNNRLTTLKGIEKLTNLKELYCDKNNLPLNNFKGMSVQEIKEYYRNNQ